MGGRVAFMNAKKKRREHRVLTTEVTLLGPGIFAADGLVEHMELSHVSTTRRQLLH